MLIKKQTKTFRADYYVDGKPETLIAEVRHDDRCGNGHNTFSITSTTYNKHGCRSDGKIEHINEHVLWSAGSGCSHDEIAKHLPQLAKYLKWHLCSTDGPLHYIANTVYHAGDRDHWGLRKGEFRQHYEDGVPQWYLPDRGTVVSATKPAPVEWLPWGRTGEGKKRDLDAARSSAIWPEATDEELTAPDLSTRLTTRLPALMIEFQRAVEELGLVY